MINEEYDLEITRVVSEIKKRNAKRILIQLAEGLKPRAEEIQEEIIKGTDESLQICFWLNSCYGKCDIPEIMNSKDEPFDLLVQFGH